jgi:hypothetical protein
MSRNKLKCIGIAFLVGLSFANASSSLLVASPQKAGHKGFSDEIRLSIATDQGRSQFLVGDKISITATLVNVGPRELLLGRDLWNSASPSRISLIVIPADGHSRTGEMGASDGFAPNTNVAVSVLNFWLMLAPGYSYGSATVLDPDRPGVYRVKATFTSEGIETNSFYNPIRQQSEESSKLQAQNWKGTVASNELTIKILPKDKNGVGKESQH